MQPVGIEANATLLREILSHERIERDEHFLGSARNGQPDFLKLLDVDNVIDKDGIEHVERFILKRKSASDIVNDKAEKISYAMRVIGR